MKKLGNITNEQIKEKGVQALDDRPNAASQYGQSGLTAAQLKLWFDKLATFLISIKHCSERKYFTVYAAACGMSKRRTTSR